MLVPVIRRYLSENHRDIFKLKNLLRKRGNKEKTNIILQILDKSLKDIEKISRKFTQKKLRKGAPKAKAKVKKPIKNIIKNEIKNYVNIINL